MATWAAGDEPSVETIDDASGSGWYYDAFADDDDEYASAVAGMMAAGPLSLTAYFYDDRGRQYETRSYNVGEVDGSDSHMEVIIASYYKVDTWFVELSEFPGPAEDRDYIQCAIEMKVAGVPIITKEEWDDINYLWPYMLTATVDLLQSGTGETSFPDQPIDLRFVRIGQHRVKVILEYPGTRRAAVASIKGLVTSIAREGRATLYQFNRVAPGVFPPNSGHWAELDSLDAWMRSQSI